MLTQCSNHNDQAPRSRPAVFCFLVAIALSVTSTAQCDSDFVNWETAPVHPLDFLSERQILGIANLPAARLELFDLANDKPKLIRSIPVGLDPVTVRFYKKNQAWVICHISDSINIVDLDTFEVAAILPTQDGPADVVFAGTPRRAYVSCAFENSVMIYDPESRENLQTIQIKGERPKAMAVSPDGDQVYVAVFESGNASTILAPRFGLSFVPGSPVDFHEGPYNGQNPPPNLGDVFNPPIANHLTERAPRVGLIVKKNQEGQWLDDNQKDWSEFVSGSKAPLSGRPIGWDMPDRDLAIIDTSNADVSYISSLMNICMDVAVNPTTGDIAVVGTDAINEVRFEPVLNGHFSTVNLALINPDSGRTDRIDLNPHLIGSKPTVPESQRKLSIGDPRQVVWSHDGSTIYVAGMGSDNLIKLDASGKRIDSQPIELEGGPSALCLDPLNSRLFVYERFASQLTVLDTVTDQTIAKIPLFDPTPEAIRKGRPHFYNTHKTSGTGHTSCASCHLDGRFDRLAWDLGTPEGVTIPIDPELSFTDRLKPPRVHSFHPMKGPMVTMTLQDIIGHEPFHWRGDRANIEAFNPTFTDLQGAAKDLSHREMAEFKAFLATLHFPPNRYRTFSNALSSQVPLSDHQTLGRDGTGEAKGTPFETGNAVAGLALFKEQGGCAECHTLSTGLGPHLRFRSRRWQSIPDGPLGERHVSLVQQARSNDLPFKIASLRGLSEKVGANFLGTESQAGFGFAHNGAVDSLTRFIQDGFNFVEDRSTKNLIAFLLSFTGSEISRGNERDESDSPGLPSKDTHASVGAQFLLHGGETIPSRLMFALAIAANNLDPVDVVVFQQGNQRPTGWFYNSASKMLENDGIDTPVSPQELIQSSEASESFLFMIVPPLTGKRMAIDWDSDGVANQTEEQGGWNPYSARSTPRNIPPAFAPVPAQQLEPGSRLEIQLVVEDGNDPPDPFTIRLSKGSPEDATIQDNETLIWNLPKEAQEQPWMFHLEAVDEGTPPETSTLVFPVFSGDRLESPLLTRLEMDIERVHIQWRVTPGKTYQVSYTNDIRHPAWFPLTAPWQADRLTLELDDRNTTDQSRFYRIAILED